MPALLKKLLGYGVAAAPCLLAHRALALRQQLAQLAQAASGRVGVAVRVLETNDTLSYHDHQAYPQLSVFKLAIALAVLREVDAGRLQLAQPVFLRMADLADTYSPLRDKYPAGNVTVPLQELLGFVRGSFRIFGAGRLTNSSGLRIVI